VPQPTPRKSDKPVFWIIAGPNGSGKSSLYNHTDIEGWGGSVWIINPDLLTATITEQEIGATNPNLAAVERIEQWLDASIQVYQTIGVETVLSSGKYRRLVEKAHDHGFLVRMIYVVLKSAELQIKRVAIRVSEGGHAVPEEKIRSRRQRSFEQLTWFVKTVDQCLIYDNSLGEPELIADTFGGTLVSWNPLPDDMQRAFDAADIFVYRGWET
jgi:predicted ABC-type ATPase